MRAYLDTQTGEVLFIEEAARRELDQLTLDDDSLEAWLAKIRQTYPSNDNQIQRLSTTVRVEWNIDDRYLEFPTQDTHEDYQEMKDFIETVDNEHVRELLEVAIDGSSAFGRFRGALHRHPEYRDKWFKFKTARQEEQLHQWLERHDIEAEFV